MILTPNAMTEEERRELMKKLGLTPRIIRQHLGKIKWRRELRLALRAEFDEKYPEDVITMFLLSGASYFDRELLAARRMELQTFKPFATSSNGEAIIFHQRVPGRRYLIGADPASGRTVSTDNTDFSAAVVIDMENCEEMAAFHARVTPTDFAWALDDLGRYFNVATIAVERTGDGGSVVLVLSGDCKYPSVAKFREWHRRNKKMIEVEGFPTNLRTRPIALNYVNKFVCETPELIWDNLFVAEALTFVRDEKGIPAGSTGTHDDTVSARWIAHGMRQHLLGYWSPGVDGRREGYVSADRLAGVVGAS
jgi:hypothetical protein